MFDLSNAYLDDISLERVLAHEFGHWIVAQETSNDPIGFELVGIEQLGDQLVVKNGGKVEFYHSWRPQWEHVLIHVAGAVAEGLFIDSTITTAAICLTLESDKSQATDAQQAQNVIRKLYPQADGPLRAERLLAAVEEASWALSSSKSTATGSSSTIEGLLCERLTTR